MTQCYYRKAAGDLLEHVAYFILYLCIDKKIMWLEKVHYYKYLVIPLKRYFYVL